MKAPAHIGVGQRRHAGCRGEFEQALEFRQGAKADVALQKIGADPKIVGDHHRDDHRAGRRRDICGGELTLVDVRYCRVIEKDRVPVEGPAGRGRHVRHEVVLFGDEPIGGRGGDELHARPGEIAADPGQRNELLVRRESRGRRHTGAIAMGRRGSA